METFDEWFNSLGRKEQEDYVEDLNAEYWIELNKEYPQYY